ncbi:hypothetical protein Moror_12453 [Moniliophthora roreri MCA 2997]|uniref:BTB domain-containing protein n=2 Tax=Moniliophthora roreri TaxID=221103 RepID=V2YVL5_MONRO|nr:hypothetical protein Moror_12453 [Moniliophthora roreri MCA 2997]
MENAGLLTYERGDPWFEDGNIILITQDPPNTAFRVHRGVLSRHSEVFQGMFELPQPEATSNSAIDYQVVPMYDLPVELSNLVKALYDGASFSNRSIRDFFYVAGILRLATKYFIGHLRVQAIHHLAQTWTYTLEGHDNMIDLAVRTPSVDDLTYPFVHPLHVLNLARETHVSVLLPSALYFLSLYPLDDLLRADHRKLSIEHPSRPASMMEQSDIKDYTLMFQHRLDSVLDFTRRICGQRLPAKGCSNTQICRRNFSRLTSRLESSWQMRTGAFHFMLQARNQVSQDETFCTSCREEFWRDVSQHRQQLWNELPSVIGLPSWQGMIQEDIPSR